MAQYDFDAVIDRRNTNSLKYDFAVERGKPADVLPLWVADMDFPAPAPVLEALHRAVDHGIFGYSEVKSGYYDVVSDWFAQRFGWQTQPQWLVKTPGVVYALAMAVRALTQPGDSVLIQPPVYYPFFSVIRDNDRVVIENELIYQDGHYAIDFEDFERKIAEQQVKLFILCSPHNPVGRVWSMEELQEIGKICRKHNVYVVSDEIHCDFAFAEHPHHVFLEANPELAEQTIICTAPSKTFNLAGLQVSNIWIPGRKLRTAFLKEIDRSGYSQLNTLGLVACQAAYQIWAESLVYNENRSFPNYTFKRYVTHVGRGGKVHYLHSPEEIRSWYWNRILMENRPPEAISGGMGSYIYLLWSDDLEELEDQADVILRHADGASWMGGKGSE